MIYTQAIAAQLMAACLLFWALTQLALSVMFYLRKAGVPL